MNLFYGVGPLGLQRKAEALLEVLTTTASTLTVHTAGRRTLGAATQEAITRQVQLLRGRRRWSSHPFTCHRSLLF
jgi:ATP-dependent Clp protease adapter protein ClpS